MVFYSNYGKFRQVFPPTLFVGRIFRQATTILFADDLTDEFEKQTVI